MKVVTKSNIFDDLEGEFVSRLREITTTSRNTVDGNATITFKTARIEANYTPNVIKKIEAGRLIAIPNVMGVTTKDAFSVYEVADVYPMHYSMLTLDRNQPGVIRKEFMKLIENEWDGSSNSTWIEIVGAPTGYTLRLDGNGTDSEEPKFVRKNVVPLTGSSVYLLSKEMIEKFICYSPKEGENRDDLTIGSLLGVTDSKIPFTLNLEKLLHYHVGVFAFTGSGKSNLTSVVIRKAIKSIPHVKFVIFDISAEYSISVLDMLKSVSSRIVIAEDLLGDGISDKSSDFLRRHVCPEALESSKQEILTSLKNLLDHDKLRTLNIFSGDDDSVMQFSTYGGLLRSIAELTNDRYQASAQKMLLPTIVGIIRQFMKQANLKEDSIIGIEMESSLKTINEIFSQTKLRVDSQLLNIFKNLELSLKYTSQEAAQTKDDSYSLPLLRDEILSTDQNSPRIFVIDLPEADIARSFCADLINKIFRARKESFNLIPKIVFVFDEAQEFIPQDKKKDDNTETSSRAVERLLRHGRKYNLHGWISTQRIAHLNTNALQQLHSYFVSTMPRPYDRQLIADTFAIDDAFMDRTLYFENGDWLMTSFKATNTQNVPVFFHAFNNEDSIVVR